MILRAAFASLGAVASILAVAAPAAAQPEPEREQPSRPVIYELTHREAIQIASRGAAVRSERRRHGRLEPVARTSAGRWKVSWLAGDDEVVQTIVSDETGRITEEWTGDQVAWVMARGYDGAFGRTLNSPFVWIPLCVLFLAPFVDPRRLLRIVHLDLIVLLAFGVSHFFFNRGEIGASVPLVYPVLLYLLGRLLWAGFRPSERRERLLPIVPLAWLCVALVLLVAFRIGLNVVDSNVIDVGYAGVIGADRITAGDPLYGEGFDDQVEHGDTYGPLSYLTYVPFEQALPWGGEWDELHAAHGAALAFDLVTLLGLVALGLRLRPGRQGRELGIALGYAWATYPYALFALQTNSNDALPAAAGVLALLACTVNPARRVLGAGLRAAAVAFGAATKFGPLVLAPLMARGDWRAPWRQAAVFGVVLMALMVLAFAPFVPDGGVRELYDRTVGYQAGRPSPFSIWGQVDSLAWLQTGAQACAVLLALALFFVPRRRNTLQLAALGGAVLIALQLGITHWFYLYVAWFAPMALVAFLGPLRGATEAPAEPAEPVRSEAVPA